MAASCDVVIDAVGYNPGTSEAILDAVPNGPLFIFTSGIMSYGSVMEGREAPLIVDGSLRQPSPSNPHGAPRVAFEDRVLARGGVVTRPGWVYGHSGGHYNKVFFGGVDAEKKTATINGAGHIRYSWVHLDDLADAYVKLVACDRRETSGKDFNLVDRDYPSREVNTAADLSPIRLLSTNKSILLGSLFLRFLTTIHSFAGDCVSRSTRRHWRGGASGAYGTSCG